MRCGRASVPVAVRVTPTRRLSIGAGKLRIHFRDQGVTSQNPRIFVAEVEAVDTSDCHSEDSGFEPRRSRQPDIDAIFATDENQTRYIN